MPARPLPLLRDDLDAVDAALRTADYTTVMRLLPPLLGELCVRSAGPEPARSTALRLLVKAYGSEAVCALRHLGATELAWISGERGHRAAALLGDPVWCAAAAYGRAHARSSMNLPCALMTTPEAADDVEPHVGDDRFARQVYGMLRLSAALTRQIQGDHAAADAHAEEAARIAAPLGDDPHAWELFGPANVGVWRASLAVEAGEPGRALTYADADADVPQALASGDRRAALRLERARAHAMLGDHRAAGAELRHAERLSPEQVHHHPLLRELVADLLLKPGGRELRGLAWRMNLIRARFPAENLRLGPAP
ncbi:XRE family transcriptional regulator [Actinomadura parmotrematis]|uniref:XRE family transcriptional regulator n=1 Tax=Actinomadura parmotrematis TaxID=2864039 RepID=A0ABS7FZI7_9ACTN|nr:XRE family transcriptional regulator [Actinomadura parmotrematis]MBW8485681.1 XRE family transcriptional regulator [Actinomadura parmotrematis]